MNDDPGRSEMASPYLTGGTVIGSYQINSFLDRGGMAFVYEATDLRLNRQVALKVLAPELARGRDFRERFLRESRFAAALDHPNIVPIYEAGEASGLLYIAMRYVKGSNLDVLLSNEGPLEPGRAIAILAPVADALDTAHAAGLVHRDVKPANILLAGASTRDGAAHVYLSDFGVTTQTSGLTKLTATGYLVGTMAYTAPEQIRGEPLDSRSDIYALGCVMYQSLTGFSPFLRDDQAALLWAHLSEQPAPISSHRPELQNADAVLARVLAKVPDDRYQSCHEFIEDLTAVLSNGKHAKQNSPVTRDTVVADPRQLPAPPVTIAMERTAAGGARPADATSDSRGSTGEPQQSEDTVREEVGDRPTPVATTELETAAGKPPAKSRRRQAVLVSATVVTLAAAGLLIVPNVIGSDGSTTGLNAVGPTSSTAPVAGPTPNAQSQDQPTGTDAATAAPSTADSSVETLPTTSTTPTTTSSQAILPARAIPARLGSVKVGETPGFAAITPDGRFAYVTDRDNNAVTVVDLNIGDFGDVSASIAIDAGPPRFITFTPDGSEAYVSVYNDDRTVNKVVVLDTRTTKSVKDIPVNQAPFAPAVSPDQTSVLVPSHDAGVVDLISTESNERTHSINVKPNPHWVAFTPDGSRAYIANHESNQVSVLDVASEQIRLIDVGTSPHSIAVSPDGARVAVVCYDSNELYFIDAATEAVIGKVGIGLFPQDVAYSADGRYVYTANVNDDTVSVVDTETMTETATIPTDSPTSIAVTPDGSRAYVTNLNTGTLTVLQTA